MRRVRMLFKFSVWSQKYCGVSQKNYTLDLLNVGTGVYRQFVSISSPVVNFAILQLLNCCC
jgi:hypothetical protein